MFCTYVLKSNKDGRLYIGSTGNLERRMWEHVQGLVKSTKYRRPLELIYKETFDTKEKAQSRENYFKGGGKARKILAELINNQKL